MRISTEQYFIAIGKAFINGYIKGVAEGKRRKKRVYRPRHRV